MEEINSAYPIKDDSEKSVYFIHINRDITESKHLESERDSFIQEEKLKIFNATVSATQHILNNLLNHMQLIFHEIEKNKTLDNETKEWLEQSLNNAANQVNKLSSVSELNEENIRKSVYPV